jgi:CheY-like chemotaxis protein
MFTEAATSPPKSNVFLAAVGSNSTLQGMLMRKTLRKWVAAATAAYASPADDPPLNYFDIFPSSRRIKILVVEDDEPDAYLIGRVLAANPRVEEVFVAEDGVKALEILDQGWFRPNMAIIDLHMPRRDGFSLLRELVTREHGGFPKVMLTSSAASADAHRAIHCGAIEFVTKPRTVDKWAQTLDRVIDNAV